MSKAGERLGISQSAVSQSVRTLEENFGTPLLNRSARPLTLTPAGMALFNRGQMLMNDALNLRGAVIEASQGIKPSLRIGIVDSCAATCGTQLVHQLLRNTAHLSLRTGLTPALGEALARRELDLVITTRSLDLEGLVNHALMSERFFIISPRQSAPVCNSATDLMALSRTLPIVRFNQQSHLGAQAERALRRMGLSPARRLEVDTADTLTAMVAGGVGWSVTTPLCLLQGGRSATAVRHDLVPELNAERTLYLHARKGEYDSLAQEIFAMVRTILQDHVSRELAAINTALPGLITLHHWKDNA